MDESQADPQAGKFPPIPFWQGQRFSKEEKAPRCHILWGDPSSSLEAGKLLNNKQKSPQQPKVNNSGTIAKMSYQKRAGQGH